MPQNLYPEITHFAEGHIALDDVHTMLYREFGNPKGIPILFLHGGPGGGGVEDQDMRFFDPKVFRIIAFDQRGCGGSPPYGELRNNTPDMRVNDIETLRKHLGIEKWHVIGGSWGSALALLYAEEHPTRTLSLTLWGIFMMRQKEIDWMFGSSPGNRSPESVAAYLDFLPENERAQPLQAYYKRLMNPDPAVHWPAAQVLKETENPDLLRTRMLVHYLVKCVFTPDDRILRNASRIRHIPTYIVHGLSDHLCPPANAEDLKKVLPQASLDLVNAGHAPHDPEMKDALLRAVDRIRDTGSPVKPIPIKKSIHKTHQP
jgi:proline iminopeptidase